LHPQRALSIMDISATSREQDVGELFAVGTGPRGRGVDADALRLGAMIMLATGNGKMFDHSATFRGLPGFCLWCILFGGICRRIDFQLFWDNVS